MRTPDVIHQYNSAMNGFDRLVSYYGNLERKLSSGGNIFFICLEVMQANVYYTVSSIVS